MFDGHLGCHHVLGVMPMAYHQFSANEKISLSSIQRETCSSIERRFSVHSPMQSFCYELLLLPIVNTSQYQLVYALAVYLFIYLFFYFFFGRF